MLEPALEYLNPKPNENFIDCTLGGGGYTFRIAEKIKPKGTVISIDLDDLAINNAKERMKKENFDNIILVQNNFKNIKEAVEDNWDIKKQGLFSGVVMDLGLSSAHLDDVNRGFSFKVDAPLKMEFGSGENTTEEIVNYWPEKELKRIIKDYGEENFSGRIASAIIAARKNDYIKTTGQLVDIISKAVPAFYREGRGAKIHFATRTFQALRIATNNELESLEKVLPASLDLLKPGAKIVVVSYHSLEDRIVKNFFKQESKDCLCPPEVPICRCGHKPRLKIISKKIILPNEEEIKNNPRARSAKMRVAEVI